MDALRPTRRVVQAPGSAKVVVIKVRNPARIVFDMEMNDLDMVCTGRRR